MGIDCPDIRQVVHVGAPDDTEAYIQATGRTGRDGMLLLATLLTTKAKKAKKYLNTWITVQNVVEIVYSKIWKPMNM